ncbi:glutamine synthetase family protein [Arthrobacter sp. NicSoilB8]|uniref:glutamine synthetase family protein n=1 Tax=Arthrobacter sp. NicSoilB8 TaxID=2830998 RepID=UPI001CC6861B|nr:glutamine synthetase family protein [Arthrobacter sp. NicSoilB8]BCW72866.1 glutamine synthetase [Arthrobacter sp. NicSoilB8]
MTQIASADESDAAKAQHELQEAGVRTVIGTVVNASGITLAKSVPLTRLKTFHESGMGAAPVWHVFTIDGGIAFTDSITTVGDMRLKIDIAGLRVLQGGRAWAPGNLFEQDGAASPVCARRLLADVEGSLDEAGYHVLVGHELEFFLVAPDGSALETAPWVPYGATGLLDRSAFLDDLLSELNRAGIPMEQIHAEYGRNQFEFSLPPASPVRAADTAVLAKLIVGIAARAHSMQASFSPMPFAGTVGNGAHQHFSLRKNGLPLFSGGSGPHGICAEGGAAIGGIIAGLPDIQGFLTGSVLSGSRLAPGTWSGAYLCWGLENREASVRFLNEGKSNPHGANVEVKIVDPSANVYLASAAILALALDGIRSGQKLPTEIPGDPGRLSEGERHRANVRLLSDSPAAIIDALDKSHLARGLLGDAVVDATVAVRRYEQRIAAELAPDELAERFRLAWSI